MTYDTTCQSFTEVLHDTGSLSRAEARDPAGPRRRSGPRELAAAPWNDLPGTPPWR